MSWRVDYAALEHGTWLSMEDELFDDIWAAIKMAQRRSERWPLSAGWRVAHSSLPAFGKITDEHLYRMIDEHGQRVPPWTHEAPGKVAADRGLRAVPARQSHQYRPQPWVRHRLPYESR